jgi:integrase
MTTVPPPLSGRQGARLPPQPNRVVRHVDHPERIPRHTHATLALQAGVHPKVISERLGHSTVAMTLDIYSPRHPRPPA